MNLSEKVKIIECPRDAMQGLHYFIPTELKADYINSLLKTGFDTIDFGSFVSPKAIPQLRDTSEVLSKLDLSSSKTNLLAIIANVRGAEDALKFEEISYLGFPFSISETFQKRNTNSTIEQSLANVGTIQNLCVKHKKELIIYISMAFGNPYGDKWNDGIATDWIKKISDIGIKIISLADTVGVAASKEVGHMFGQLIPAFMDIEFGAHLHCKADNWYEKVNAAFMNGCRRFDTAIKGFGGCPMAEDELIGNLATENLVQYLEEKNVVTGIDKIRFSESLVKAADVFAQTSKI
ncbi:MAG TPA: hydroxymethylglutaryl-CoA lyase [Bacteroidia bacterium]|nr:hydroxymethylglutaryl-CoA lyase [Bacteroidia bacterium]